VNTAASAPDHKIPETQTSLTTSIKTQTEQEKLKDNKTCQLWYYLTKIIPKKGEACLMP
jgi:hypothetical protein